jgi:hypothetical protein
LSTSSTNKPKESGSRSERVRKTWQNPSRRVKQTAALKKCWQREDYRNRLTEHLRQISEKGRLRAVELRRSGPIKISDESRRHLSEAQRKRFQRPEEQRKLERARLLSRNAVDPIERAKKMREAFIKKYGSLLELARMGMRAPKRKPSKLEIEVVKSLGDEWTYVGDGKLVIGGLVPDFINKNKKEVLEVLGCYYHTCQIHYPKAPVGPKTQPAFRESVYRANGYDVQFLWEHDIKKRRKLAFAQAGVADPSVYAV